MRIGIASDHAGFRMKQVVTTHLADLGHQVDDLGTDSEEPVDDPGLLRGGRPGSGAPARPTSAS